MSHCCRLPIARSASGTTDGVPLQQVDPERLRPGDVPDTRGGHPFEALQPVRVDRRSGRDVLRDEREHRRLFEIRDHGHSDPTRRVAPFLHRHQYNGGCSPLELPTASQAGLWPADPGVVDLDLAMQGLTAGIDHGAPQLVQEHPRGFVPAQPQLPLEQERRDAPLVGDHQIGRPAPHGQGRLRVVENRAGGQRHLVPAGHALPAAVRRQSIAARVPTATTHEPVRPATRRQVVLTGFLGRELPVEFPQILGKRRARHPLHYIWWLAETTG